MIMIAFMFKKKKKHNQKQAEPRSNYFKLEWD